MELNRRSLLAGATFAFLLQCIAPVLAESGSGGGNSGSGGGDSGSDGDNSGPGGDSDDNDNDNDNDDNDGDSGDDSLNNSGSGKHGAKDQYAARKAVAKGSAVSLTKLKAFLAKNYPGKILKLDLEKRLGGYVYKVRVLQAGNHVRSVNLNARTLQRSLF